MTVGELRAFLADVPDEYPVLTMKLQEEWGAATSCVCHYAPGDPSLAAGTICPDDRGYDPQRYPPNAVVIS